MVKNESKNSIYVYVMFYSFFIFYLSFLGILGRRDSCPLFDPNISKCYTHSKILPPLRYLTIQNSAR
jgi:hypothetical protein